MRGRPTILALALLSAACTSHEDHAGNDAREAEAAMAAADYVDHLPEGDGDARVGMLVGFVRVADEMMRSPDPVERHVATMTLRQTCMEASYGARGGERRQDVIDHLAVTPRRKTRWWRYVVISSSRPAVEPSDEACNF